MKNFVLGFLLCLVGAFGYNTLPGFVNTTNTNTNTSISSIHIPEGYTLCPKASLTVRRMLYSLDTEPLAWSSDGYTISRKGGGSMWIANADYGIAIGSNYRTNKLDNAEERTCLYAAYQRWVTNPVNY